MQDPSDLSKFNITSFHRVKNNLRVETEGRYYDLFVKNISSRVKLPNFISEELEFRAKGNMGILKSVANETKVILNQLERDYKPAEAEKQADKPKLDKFNAVS